MSSNLIAPINEINKKKESKVRTQKIIFLVIGDIIYGNKVLSEM